MIIVIGTSDGLQERFLLHSRASELNLATFYEFTTGSAEEEEEEENRENMCWRASE